MIIKMKGKAVFLDRDGTIIREVRYLRDSGQLELLPGAAEAIKMLNEAGFKVILITNQSAIARKYLTEEELGEIHQELRKKLKERAAYIDKIYYCPHHPEENCNCRKPKPKLVSIAARDHMVDLCHSYFVGDKYTDIKAGKNAGCKTILVLTGYGREEVKRIGSDTPDHVSKDLYDATQWIVDGI